MDEATKEWKPIGIQECILTIRLSVKSLDEKTSFWMRVEGGGEERCVVGKEEGWQEPVLDKRSSSVRGGGAAGRLWLGRMRSDRFTCDQRRKDATPTRETRGKSSSARKEREGKRRRNAEIQEDFGSAFGDLAVMLARVEQHRES